ncbi:hypothetical protein QTQ03_16585 [Micromonospora sp. WMMA1363]|uniref:hypothetical protein n=1 Tax=Micromonospora sp. WMMA1363 TaxID=3053985 RepID=UPI00259CFB5E|nr:hypothetical protein [Micromonospora sp. WMMA1363]MDM4721136.1 hypothetical protein [Micromonospora sp. WMMA1363]
MTSTTPSAGGILAASAALQDPNRDTFSRAEVAYLMHLAYDSGRTATRVDDIAHTVCCWDDRPLLRRTYEQRVAGELTDMDRAARAQAGREGRPYRVHPGGPVDFDTGRPVRHLGVAA